MPKIKKTFMNQLLNGNATIYDIDRYIQEWELDPNLPDKIPMHEWLGFTEEEWEAGKKYGNKVVPLIIRSRNDGMELDKLIKNAEFSN